MYVSMGVAVNCPVCKTLPSKITVSSIALARGKGNI
jgi:hypothetical protein